MSLLEQLLFGLNHQPQYVDLVISFFELPDDLSVLLAQIRWHDDYQLTRQQIQTSMLHRNDHSIASPTAPLIMSPSKSAKTPAQYRCSQYACRSLPPYKTLGHFRNHMSVKHNEKDIDCSIYQVVETSVDDASVHNNTISANTPKSQSRMTLAPSFLHTHGGSEQPPVINSPLPTTPFHLNNSTALATMHTFPQTQNKFNGAYTQPHTPTLSRWTQ